MTTTVLVVDDYTGDRTLLAGLLQQGTSVDVDFAEDGSRALEMIAQSPPSIVVTDLHMPELNGLELVEAIHQRHPTIPVVLVTGRGSEELAVEALKKGAASYVPKTSLSRDLLPTVMHVLAVARANQDLKALQVCWQENVSRFELPNDYNLISPLVGQIKQLVEAMQLFDPTEQVQLAMALEEAVSNALYHGNLELSPEDLSSITYDLFDESSSNVVDERISMAPYKDRKVQVEARLSRQQVQFVIRDEGPGFDHRQLPEPGDVVTASDPGRALTHMRLFSDEIIFNEIGNQVTLVKHCH